MPVACASWLASPERPRRHHGPPRRLRLPDRRRPYLNQGVRWIGSFVPPKDKPGPVAAGAPRVQGSFPARRQQHILHPPLKVFLFQTFSRFHCREAYPFLHLQVTGVSSTPPLDRVSTPRRSSSSTTAFRFPLNRCSSWLSLILVLKVADLILRASGPPVERASESRTGKI